MAQKKIQPTQIDITALQTALGSSGGSSAWGGITGTLSAQTDLNTALTAKAALAATQTFSGTNTFSNEIRLSTGLRVLSDGNNGVTLDGSGLTKNNWNLKQGSDGTFLFDQGGGLNARFKLGSATSSTYIDFTPDFTNSVFKIRGDGQATFSTLAGTGSRMVVTDASGVISSQTIPSGGAVSSLTTTGSGAATLSSGVLNIPTPVIPTNSSYVDLTTAQSKAGLLTLTTGLALTGSAALNIGSPTTTGYSLSVQNASTQLALLTNTQAGASGGAGIIAAADSAAAQASGDRLGFFLFAGAQDASHSLSNQAGMVGYTTQAWTSTTKGAQLQFQTTPNGSTTRATVFTLGQDASAVFTGSLTAPNIAPPTTNTGNFGTSSLFWANSYITKQYFNASYWISTNASALITNSDFWGDKGFKFGAGASTGTDPFNGAIAGLKGYTAAPVFVLQPFSTATASVTQQWRNAAGTTVLQVNSTGVLAPGTTGGNDLGTSALYFANTWATRHNFNSTAYIDGTTAGTLAVTGSLTATNANLTTPTIANFTNATHAHTSAATGGVLTGYVDTTTAQTIAGAKTLSNTLTVNGAANITADVTIGPAAGTVAQRMWVYSGPNSTAGKRGYVYADYNNVYIGTESTGNIIMDNAYTESRGVAIQEAGAPYQSSKWWFDGTSGTGTGNWFSMPSGGPSFNIRLGDGAGAGALIVKESGGTTKLSVNSYGVHFMGNTSVVPTTNPTGGGLMYVDAGALKWRGPSGTVTVIGAA